MNQFSTILKFELKNYFKNKVFVGTTVFLVLLITAVIFFPRISAFVKSEDNETEKIDSVMLVSAESDEISEAIRDAFSAAFPEYNVKVADCEVDGIKKQISDGEAKCAFVIDDITSYKYYVDTLSIYDQNTYTADEILQSIYRMSAMIQGGIAADQVENIMSVQIDHETESLGKDQTHNFFYTYIMIFALYMVILLYGQMVATNVASEKSSKAMELLITSAKPASMMFGKVIASCLAGLIQLICVFGSAIVLYNFNRSYWGDNEIINSIFDMPVDVLLYMLLFFVLGFFIYAFMYGAVGSTASKLEDINTSVMPITMLFIVAFMIVMFSMGSGNVDNLLMKICSYIPFTSPMAMFTRIAMSNVMWYEIAASTVILIGSVIGIGVLSAKIYRVGVLLYGTTPKIGAVIKSIRKA